MQNSGYGALGTVSGVPSGSQASMVWNGLSSGTQYEWYAVVSNGTATTTGATWNFTTATGPTPTVNFSSSNLTFGNQQINSTSAAQTVTLTNTGTATLNIISIVASGDSAQTNTCGASVAAAGSCTISVTFIPTATGTRTGAITVTDSASGSPQIVNLTGNGTTVAAPAVSLSTTSLSFGNQQISTASAAQTITLTNTGNGVLSVTSIVASGDYAQTNTCGTSVAAGANCTISVTFTPTATGTRTGAITITDNAAGSPHIVSLTGTGSAILTYSIRPTGKFTEAMSGNTGVSSQTVTNTGFAIATGDLIVAIVRIGNSGESTSTCSDNVNSGNYAQAHYQEDTSNGRALIQYYKANSASALSGSLTITCRYPVPNHAYLGALDYSGAATSSPLDGHMGTTFTTATASPTSGSITPTQSGDLFVGSLYISESSTVTVSSESTGFTKELTGNEGTANFQHAHSADEVLSGASAQNYHPTFSSSITTMDILTAYKAWGGGSASVSLSSTSLTFASQLVGSTSAAQTVTLNNTGNAALSVTSIVASGDYAQTNTCGTSVAAGANCTISVTFTPTATGTRTGAITITDNAVGSPHTVSLTGTGTAPVLSLSSTTLTFGSQLMNTTSAAQSVTLNNTGNAALSVTSIVASGDYAQTNTCGSSVAAGANCTISVTFTPTATGTRTGAITITDNAAGSPHIVSLTGTGSAILTYSIRPTGKFTEAMSGNTGVSSQTVTNTGFAIATGDLIVAIVRIGNSGESTSTCSDNVNSGNYAQAHYQEDTSNGRALIQYYKANSASALSGSLTITCRYPVPNHAYLGALDYSGAATSSPLDGHMGTTFTTATASPTSGSITPTQSGDLFVGSLYISESSTVTVSSESTGFTKELTGNEGTANFQHAHSADEVLSGASAQNYH